MEFDDFFRKATGDTPFPFQRHMAMDAELADLIDVPTGSGKTAAVVLAWLWRLTHRKEPAQQKTPRRLVYCLPMRVLVEQTRDEVTSWISKLDSPCTVVVLMGGEDAEDWDLDPEKPVILIGTQDMLLSRALNRGYGMSRYRWPLHFGLLNNDCVWVLDEIQLMGVGLATSTQLQAFREQFGHFGEVRTIWMSATLRREWLATVNFRERSTGLVKLQLTDEDYGSRGFEERWNARKPIAASALKAGDVDGVASFIKDHHRPGSLTLVVVNIVDRSRAIFEALRKLYAPRQTKGRAKKVHQTETADGTVPELKLLHSRFRPIERQTWRDWLKDAPPSEGRIIIATQVIEAGVDISAQTLITELAPWPSLVQRFGRCNRRGEYTESNPAKIYWVDVPSKDERQAAPYSQSELNEARAHLVKLRDAGLKSLQAFLESLSNENRAALFPFDPPHVIRSKDFVDLFDTTPDLSGNDIDVSRFIREGDNLDVQVFWRTGRPPSRELRPKEARQFAAVRVELCPVPVGSIREFLEHPNKTAYHWNALESRWFRATSATVFAGQVFWLPKDQGGYSAALGWDPKAAWDESLDLATPTPENGGSYLTSEPDYDSDLLSLSVWRSIAEHTDEVISELHACARDLGLAGIPWNAIEVAIRWHDWGKAHKIFQDAIKDEADGDYRRPGGRTARRDIAKASPDGFWRKYERKHFRHELASALGILTLLRRGKVPRDWADLSPESMELAVYLIAAHHGKVRLSIRSLPDENKPPGVEPLFARGVWHGDELPEVDLGSDVTAPNVHDLDLTPMQLGRSANGSPSWAEAILKLRDRPEIGPIRLAFLEMIVRAADMRASKKADERDPR